MPPRWAKPLVKMEIMKTIRLPHEFLQMRGHYEEGDDPNKGNPQEVPRVHGEPLQRYTNMRTRRMSIVGVQDG
jgi:hypothetical protein